MFDGEVAADAGGDEADAVDMDVQERVGAEMFGNADRAAPGAGFGGELQMFGAHADRMGIVRLGKRAGGKVHARRADEAGDEDIVGPVIEIERRADLLDIAGVQDDDLVGHGHGFDLVMGDVDHRRLRAGDAAR